MTVHIHDTLGHDGTRLTWRSRGQGPLILMTTGVSNDEFVFGPLIDTLVPHGRVVTWDYAGHGDSEPSRDPGGLTIPGVVRDLERVLDATGEEQAVLVGFSVGCQVVLEAWRRFPERIRAIVLLLGTPGRPLERFLSPTIGPLTARMLRRLPPRVLGGAFWLGASVARVPFYAAWATGVIEPRVRYRDFRPFLHHLGRLDAASYQHLVLAAQAHDAREVLPTIRVPALVVTGGTDVFTPVDVGQAMAEAIPGAESLFLPEAGHAGLIGHQQEIDAAVEVFLVGRGLVEA